MRANGWTDLYDWHIDRASNTPIFRQIYLQARAAILSRTFSAGAKLPSTRDLASRLRVARASVVAAYEQLFAEGYLSGKIGSGTYVSFDLPEPVDRRAPNNGTPRNRKRRTNRGRALGIREFPEASLQDNDRPFNTGRTLVDARTLAVWRTLTGRSLRAFGDRELMYSDPRGSTDLRKAICQYLQAARAVQCTPDQIIVTSGTQQGIDIAIRVLLRPDDEVWVEDPGYPLTRHALAMAGAKLRPIPVDAQGINVRAAMKAAPRATAAVVTPSHQFPTGVVLSMARRLELLAWARETGGWIIEDDYASEFRYSGRPLASLQGLDDCERVIYFGTLNKTLFPGLRIGYAVVPPPLLKAFTNARCLMDRQPPTLQQAILAEFMQEGHLAAHIRRLRLAYRDQRDLLVAELSRRARAYLTVQAPDQGMYLVANLRQGLRDIDVEAAARRNGLVVRAMSPLYKKASPRSALMLGFSGYPRQRILPAVASLGRVLRMQRQPEKQ
jgi:GntR family transcriptional regulator / MocR family aminotransferase